MLTLTPTVLLTGLKALADIVPTKTSLPILKSVRMTREAHALEVFATDLEMSGQWVLPLPLTTRPWQIVVPFKGLQKTLRGLPPKQSLELGLQVAPQNELWLQVGNLRILGAEPLEYPEALFPEMQFMARYALTSPLIESWVRASAYIDPRTDHAILRNLLWGQQQYCQYCGRLWQQSCAHHLELTPLIAATDGFRHYFAPVPFAPTPCWQVPARLVRLLAQGQRWELARWQEPDATSYRLCATGGGAQGSSLTYWSERLTDPYPEIHLPYAPKASFTIGLYTLLRVFKAALSGAPGSYYTTAVEIGPEGIGVTTTGELVFSAQLACHTTGTGVFYVNAAWIIQVIQELLRYGRNSITVELFTTRGHSWHINVPGLQTVTLQGQLPEAKR